MRRVLLVLVLAAGVVALLVWWRGRVPPTLYRGGPVLTMDAGNRVVSALAVEDGRVAAVGSAAELEGWAEERGARIVELAGRALLPGFIDAHGHYPGNGIYAVHVDLNSPPIGDTRTVDDVVAKLAERAAATASGEWIVGWGYDDTLLAERRHPTRRDLDRASTDHPLALWHVSGHLAVANGPALERLGIGPDTPDPEGGVIRRQADGRTPDGVLEEHAMDPLLPRIQPGLLDGLRMVREATRLYLAAGVTTAQSGASDRSILSSLAALSRWGLVPLRLVLWPLEDAADGLLDGSLDEPVQGPFLSRGAVKLIADGSIQGYTGYLSEPYHVPPGDDPGFRGYPRIERDDLIERVTRYHRQGFQLAVHGNGDASIDDILDAFEAALAAHPRPDARPIVIHAQMARDDQLERMARLGVIPSFFSLHTYYWGDRHRDLFMGPERAARMSPARSALDRGVRFTIHCDTPVVPMEPLRLVWAAVNRRSTSGAAIGPGQRIGVMAALRAVTADAAYQHFQEDRLGSLEPGKLADLVILSRSPLEDPATLDRIEVLETVIGGRSVYRRDG
ncbi:MAG: amidohydrolase [Myxococcota bacterium]